MQVSGGDDTTPVQWTLYQSQGCATAAEMNADYKRGLDRLRQRKKRAVRTFVSGLHCLRSTFAPDTCPTTACRQRLPR